MGDFDRFVFNPPQVCIPIITMAPTPRERAPFEKRKPSPGNRSPANKTPKPSLSRNSPPKPRRAQEKMGTAHQARSSDRSSPLRLRRHLSRRRLHHRAEGDSQNLDSSRKKKKRLALATRALATDFRPRHLSEYLDTRTAGLSFHTHPPGGDTPQPPSPVCSSSATLTRTQSGCTVPS